MPAIAELLTTHLFLFTLVLARVGGLVITAPMFSALAVPKNVRGVMGFAIALLIAPTQTHIAIAAPATSIDWVLALAVELLLGLALGLGTAILVGGAQLAGQLIAQLSGLSLAEVFDPNLGATVPLFSQLLGLFSVAVYLLIGGHRWLIAGLLESFRTLPPGGMHLPAEITHTLVSIMTEGFSLGIRAAVPAIVALLLATIILGLLSRTMTQLNVMSLGFGLNALVAFGALAISLGSAAYLFEDEFQPAISRLLEAVGPNAAIVSGNH
jgi:flagellar biosynthetic protein FliR